MNNCTDMCSTLCFSLASDGVHGVSGKLVFSIILLSLLTCSAGSWSTCHYGKCQRSIYFSGKLFMPQTLNVAEESFFSLEENVSGTV